MEGCGTPAQALESRLLGGVFGYPFLEGENRSTYSLPLVRRESGGKVEREGEVTVRALPLAHVFSPW